MVRKVKKHFCQGSSNLQKNNLGINSPFLSYLIQLSFVNIFKKEKASSKKWCII